MAQIIHDISTPNDGLGDPLRTAFDNQNDMNTELYTTKVDIVAGQSLTDNNFSDADVIKLASIATGAEVNVQADWLASDPNNDSYILNKPDMYADNSDKIIALGTISRDGNNFSHSVGFSWRINLSIKFNPAVIVITPAVATVGFLRTDITVLDALNNIILIQGVEHATAPVQPSVPADTLFLSVYQISGVTISNPTLPIVGSIGEAKENVITKTITEIGASSLSDNVPQKIVTFAQANSYNRISGILDRWNITDGALAKVYILKMKGAGDYTGVVAADLFMISQIGGGSGGITSVTGTTVNNTDPNNPIVGVASLQQVTDIDNVTTLPIKVSELQLYNSAFNGYTKVNVNDTQLSFINEPDPTRSFAFDYTQLTAVKGYELVNESGALLTTLDVILDKTAVFNANYINKGTVIYTDPSIAVTIGSQGYTVYVVSGTAEIGGDVYGIGSLVYRYYDGTAWFSKTFGSEYSQQLFTDATAENGVFYTSNFDLTITDPVIPFDGKGYIVYSVSGTFIIDGISYPPSSLVYRFYKGSEWFSKAVGGSDPLKEDTANKSASTADSASSVKFPVWSAVVAYVTSLGYATTAYVTSALASFKTANFLDFTSSGQTQLNSKLSKAGDTISGDISNTSTGFFRVASGTTAQRPTTPLDGMIRYNTTTLRTEFYSNGSWRNMARLEGDTFTGAISATNLSGTNTGDETTASIQTKRPIKTVNGTSLEGSGNVTISSGIADAPNDAFAYVRSGLAWVVGYTKSAIDNLLNGKQNLLGYTPYKFIQNSETALTGAVIGLTETIVATATVNANTFNASDIMNQMYKCVKPATTANVTMRIRINTTNSLVTATQVAILTLATTNTFALLTRSHNLIGGNLLGYNFNSSIASDTLATNTAGSSMTLNPATIFYVFFTVQLGNAADSVTPSMANLNN